MIDKRKRDRQYDSQKKEGQIIRESKERGTDNTIVKRKRDRQCDRQKKEGQTIR